MAQRIIETKKGGAKVSHHLWPMLTMFKLMKIKISVRRLSCFSKSGLITLPLLTAFAFAMAAGCSSTPTSTGACQELDWYEIGRSDGARGQAATKQREVKVVCDDTDQSLSEALYQNGFDSGMSQFCNPQIAFEQGRLHLKNSAEVCPPFLRTDYVSAYQRGLRYSDLQANQKDLSHKIESVTASLVHANDDTYRATLTNEKLELELKKRAVDQEIGSLENDKKIYLK
jgi:Protein of unknown function (DUF2799)